MIDVMIDLETLGTRPGCKVLSIGAVNFSPRGLMAGFYAEIKRDGQGTLVEDPATVKWWEQQDPAVRDRLLRNDDIKLSLQSMLTAFSNFLNDLTDENNDSEVTIWGNGADFDNPILCAAYHNFRLEPPWCFFRNRCYRTLKSLAPEVKIQRVGDHHNALDDARSQAEHAVRLLKHLKVWPSEESPSGGA